MIRTPARPYRRLLILLALLLLAHLTVGQVARGAGAPLTAEQQQAADKIKAKGGSVMQQAADSNALVVNLGLAGKSAGDEEVGLLKSFPKVVELDLHGTGVTDAGLAALDGMKDLTHLRLDHTQVTDAGLAHVEKLSALVYLNLFDTPVTDAGLEHLKGLKSLRRVYLWQTKVTDAGGEALRKALPDATVNRGEGMIALTTVPAVVPTPAPEKKPPVPGKAPDKAPDKVPDKRPAAATVAAAPGPDDLKPDGDGFFRAWLLLAPLPIDGTDGAAALDRQQLADEKDLKPKPDDKAKAGDKELTWKPIKAGDYYFDVGQALGAPQDYSAAYAVVYVDAEAEKTGLHLLMGSNDQGKLYLNGKEVLKSTVPRSIAQDQDKADGVTLNKGTNVVVFKVINEANNWQGCVRFTDKDGKPVKDLKLKLAP